LAQDQAIEQGEEENRHDKDDPLLDVKLKLDDFVSEWWSVGLNYDCKKIRRRAQEANFTQKFCKRIDAVFDRVRSFGPDVAHHGHDVLAIGRCLQPLKGGGTFPANARKFEARLKSFENFLVRRKAD
jgi:hypothetical protein